MNPSEFLPTPENYATVANHAGQEPENWSCMSVTTPITLTTTFKHFSPTEYKKYEYSRKGNPTREALETCLAELEGSNVHGLCFSSGMAAALMLVNSLETGDHIISCDELYGGVNLLFNQYNKNFKVDVSFIDCSKIENIEKAVKPNTKMIFIETPTNPSLKVLDIKKIGEVAKKHKIMFVVDNTFLTSYLQRPLELGADVVMYSVTKYLNGHTDVVMGALMFKNVETYQKIKKLQNALGMIPSPFDCFLVLRGLKTLPIRLMQHGNNGYMIGKYLQNHPKIEKVIYPSLPSHPQYDLAKKQTSGSSGMLCVYLKGGKDKTEVFLKSLKLFTLAGSLGGTESLIALPYHMTHPQLNAEEKAKLGITESLVRMSIGIEDVNSLIEDLKQALDKC